MAASPQTIRKLRRYGAKSAANKLKLECWLAESIQDMGDNKGGNVSSASANGASFSKEGMSNSEWSDALDQAILMIDSGVKSVGRSYGRMV